MAFVCALAEVLTDTGHEECASTCRLRTHTMPTVMASRSSVGSAVEITMSTTWYKQPLYYGHMHRISQWTQI